MSDETRASWIPATKTPSLPRQRHANGTGKSWFERWHNRRCFRAFSFLISGFPKLGGPGYSANRNKTMSSILGMQGMLYRTLGSTGEKVSAIGIGGWHIG